MESPVNPEIRGAGLMGRPPVRPPNSDFVEPLGYDEAGEPIYAQPPAPGPALPTPCLYLLNSLRAEAYCSGDCPGVQPDGGCLCDIVRAANEQGIEWSFEVEPQEGIDERHGGAWIYTGPPLDGR